MIFRRKLTSKIMFWCVWIINSTAWHAADGFESCAGVERCAKWKAMWMATLYSRYTIQYIIILISTWLAPFLHQTFSPAAMSVSCASLVTTAPLVVQFYVMIFRKENTLSSNIWKITFTILTSSTRYRNFSISTHTTAQHRQQKLKSII